MTSRICIVCGKIISGHDLDGGIYIYPTEIKNNRRFEKRYNQKFICFHCYETHTHINK